MSTRLILLIALILTVPTPQTLTSQRDTLAAVIFGGSLPSRSPDRVDPINDARFGDVDRVTIRQDFGINSIGYHVKRGNYRLLIYHAGHNQDFRDAAILQRALDAGWDVAGFNMPLMGGNPTPDVCFDRVGCVTLDRHDKMSWLQPQSGHTVRYFLEPVIIFLNRVSDDDDYDHIRMAGISGGGWTTTLIAAVDTRIDTSFPVAGSMPLRLRQGNDWGDWEQWTPDIYRLASYEDLYVMGTIPNRYQVQILNDEDSCCFAGDDWQEYAPDVAERAAALGGSWRLYQAENDRHTINEAATAMILAPPRWVVWLPVVAK